MNLRYREQARNTLGVVPQEQCKNHRQNTSAVFIVL